MSPEDTSSPTAVLLKRGVDLGLGAVIFAAPLFMSGRHGAGLFVYVLLCTLTFSLWMWQQVASRRRKIGLTGAEWIWLAAIIIVAIQLIPLPPKLLTAISPESQRLLPLWFGEDAAQVGFTTWSQISLDPQSTRGSLVLLAAYAMLFTVAAQRIQAYSDAERLLKWIGCAAAGYSLLALIQMFATKNNTLAIFDCAAFTHTRGARGAFPNPNHFGHFAALGIGPLLMWIHSVWRREKTPSHSKSVHAPPRPAEWLARFAAPALLSITLIAAVATFSRGAAIDLAMAVIVFAAIVSFKRIADKRVMVVGGASLAVACLAVGLHEHDRITDEMATLTQGVDGLDNSHLRRTIWNANLEAGKSFSLLGAGAGSQREVYRAFLDTHLDSEMSHAESGYLQIWSENGSAGVLVLGMAIVLGGLWLLRALRGGRDRQPAWLCAAAAAAGLAASLLHSAYDFIWFVPACATFALILLAVVCRVGRLHLDSHATRAAVVPERAWLVGAVCSVVLAAVMVHDRVAPLRAFPHWQSYLALSHRANDFDTRLSQQASGAIDPTDVSNLNRMIRHLQLSINANPRHARAHVRLAGLLERRFEVLQLEAENAMPLSQFRDAAFASQFPSKQAQEDWLTRAMGENREPLDDALAHARRGLALCPMHGEAYCQLSNMAFLEGYGPAATKAFIEQARLVRPRNSVVLLTAGLQAVNSGDLEEAQSLLKTVFRQEPRFQVEIVNLFGFSIPPQTLVQMFEPDYEGLKTMFGFYKANRIPGGLELVGGLYAEELEGIASRQSAVQAARNLVHAHSVYRDTGNNVDALRCIQKASKLSPRDLNVRRNLGRNLRQMGRFDEAVKELQWCLKRRPNDDAIRAELAEANRQRLAPRQANPNSRPISNRR